MQKNLRSSDKNSSGNTGCRPSLWKWLQNKNEEKKVLNWCSNILWKKLETTQDATPQNSSEKQYCQYWILRLVVFTRFPANRDCLLKLYMLVKSARTVSRELYWGKRVHIALTHIVSCGCCDNTLLVCRTCLHAVYHRPMAWGRASQTMGHGPIGVAKPIGLTNQN